ncbi:MAG: RidA family protein [Promethearchaeota archaeon]|nr:MAG: RidA family protein [Candidatus Lokiarchaeota archaeon]
MVNIEHINPGTPVAGPYTPGVKVGNLLFVSGQGAKQGTTEIKEQAYSVLENIKAIVEAAGGTVANIIHIKVYLRDMNDFGKMNRTYKKFFNDNGVTEKFPSRTTIEVSNLPVASMLLEIDAIASI